MPVKFWLVPSLNTRRVAVKACSSPTRIIGVAGSTTIEVKPVRLMVPMDTIKLTPVPRGNRRAARGILADDIPRRHGRAWRRGYRADVQADPANCTLGRSLGLSHDVGNRGCLRSRGDDQTDCRACRDTCSRGYPLADHLARPARYYLLW